MIVRRGLARRRTLSPDGEGICALGLSAGGGPAVSYWKVIRSVRVSVTAFAFKGAFAKFSLPEFKTL